MRLFAVKDETMPKDKVLGYLIYYEIPKSFYIELPDHADPWETSPILSPFVNRGIYSIDSSWSRRWVQQRIVPQDRQNIGQILRDNGLKEYDEFSLLMLTKGRCEQDDCYLEEISPDNPPELLIRRWQTKVEDIIPLDAPLLLVFFRNGMTKIIDTQEVADPACAPYLSNQDRFSTVEVQPDGYGVYWNAQAMISHRDLFMHGVTVPLTLLDFHHYVQDRVVSASEACSLLECSRQNIDDLMRRDKLHPIRTDAKYKLFSKAEVMQRRKD
ncbi:MAG: hypothetical protein IKS55_15105 [Oscillospiraceae bacterium]|nr:hypothetical protein [Oscillospiraceae bacterium]